MSDNRTLAEHAKSWCHQFGFRIYKPEHLDAAADAFELRVNRRYSDFIAEDFKFLKRLNDAERRMIENKGALDGSERLLPERCFDATITLKWSDTGEVIGEMPIQRVPRMRALEHFKEFLSRLCRTVPEVVDLWKKIDTHGPWWMAKGDYDKAAQLREHSFERFKTETFYDWQKRLADKSIKDAVESSRRGNDQRIDGVGGDPLPPVGTPPVKRGRVKPARGVLPVDENMTPRGQSQSGRLEAFERELAKRNAEYMSAVPTPPASKGAAVAGDDFKGGAAPLPKPKKTSKGKSEVDEMKESK